MTDATHADPTIDSASTSPQSTPLSTKSKWGRGLFIIGAIGFITFWTWVLLFASKEPVNGIGDPQWVADANQICAAATQDREALANYTTIRSGESELIVQRAEIIDQATDILETMVADLAALPVSTEKGQAIVPLWIADYERFVADRRVYADQLRAEQENSAFYETRADTGIPISEKIATFAADNRAEACAPPRDLGR